MDDSITRAKEIRLAIFDVDGVLTDGSLYFSDDGQEYKSFNARDGLGMVLLQQHGVEIAIITGRRSEVVTTRMESLGITRIFQGQQMKLPAYQGLIADMGLEPEQVAYLGDDIIDLPVMIRVGLAVAVADAHPEVKKHAHWQTPNRGGRGAARDLCELIMEAQGRWQGQLEALLKR